MDLRNKIVNSALSLFYRNGFCASGVESLRQEAGVTKKTLYRYFPNKESLIVAALALRQRQFMEQLQVAVERVKPEERPLAYIDFIADWVQERGFHGCAFINVSAEHHDPGQSPRHQARMHKQETREYLLRLCAESGASEPEVLTTALFLLGEGLTVGTQVLGRDPSLVDTARHVARSTWLKHLHHLSARSARDASTL